MDSMPRARSFLLSTILLLISSTALFAQSWTPTATKAINLASASSLGALPDSAPIHIAVALQMRNRSSLDQMVLSMNTPGDPIYGTELSPDQFAATFAPTSDQVQAVVSYLSAQGMSNIQAEPNNLFVTADATVAQIRSAFNTQLNQFLQNGNTVFANIAPAQAPSSLSGIVLAVLGLNNASVMQAPRHSQSLAGLPLPYPKFYAPQDFWKAYDVGSTPAGSNTSIAIFAEGDLTQVLKDLRFAESQNKLPQVPVTVVQTGLASPDTAGMDEWDLDTQMSTGMAQNVKRLYIYDATSLTDADVTIMFNRFAAQKLAKAGSASFGECELFPFLDGAMVAMDQVFAQAAVQGQTVFASSGDNGGSCPVEGATNGVPDSGPPGVAYPASSPYVVGVGGTSLFTNSDGSYLNEAAWNAGGGGPSVWETAPFWQSGIVPGTAVGKGVPDIAMDADLLSGALVYIGPPAPGTCNSTNPNDPCNQFIVGGTSLSSPLSLGVWARLESSHANKLGFASINLYRAYKSAGFHDIILGSNGIWPATPGWDYTTGLGSFDVAHMNQVVGH